MHLKQHIAAADDVAVADAAVAAVDVAAAAHVAAADVADDDDVVVVAVAAAADDAAAAVGDACCLCLHEAFSLCWCCWLVDDCSVGVVGLFGCDVDYDDAGEQADEHRTWQTVQKINIKLQANVIYFLFFSFWFLFLFYYLACALYTLYKVERSA